MLIFQAPTTWLSMSVCARQTCWSGRERPVISDAPTRKRPKSIADLHRKERRVGDLAQWPVRCHRYASVAAHAADRRMVAGGHGWLV